MQFWGKARPPQGTQVTWHPVAYHLLDVAAVVEAILLSRPITRQRASSLLQATNDDAVTFLVALAALHDIGKFAPGFQAMSAEHWPNALKSFKPSDFAASRHTEDGYFLWERHLAERLADSLISNDRRNLDTLLLPIFGHHGRPLVTNSRHRILNEIFPEPSLDAAQACATEILKLLIPSPIRLGAGVDDLRIASWWVSGIVTIADWIGSNSTWFPYASPDLDPGRYWEDSRVRAARAVKEAGLSCPTPSAPKSFAELTGKRSPTPLQEWAANVVLPDGPVMVVMEDITGAGKTEAAQMLVHRMISARRVSGAFWAMPTMATANAMFLRQAAILNSYFNHVGDSPAPSVVLAHGQAHLYEHFQQLVRRNGSEDYRSRGSDEEQSAEAACSSFLADNRRAALLADIGAGTVDQVIMGALPLRFNTVRLLGMADKVLVIDEAHAYDPYMGVEIEQVLRFQSSLGGSAIVLSATLTASQRERLATAWTEGIEKGRRRTPPLFGGSLPKLTAALEYPLASVIASGDPKVIETPIRPAPWSKRSIGVRFVHSVEDALEHVMRSADRGAAVAWIRNTVDDCLSAVGALRLSGYDPIVFHARFAQCDRQNREKTVMDAFGPGGRGSERSGRIVIATQVIEQSLDLDFDVLISDLAPVDLIVQRAGRLWRHTARDGERPAGIACELTVLSPRTDEEPTSGWLRELLPGTSAVYSHTGVLWHTARALAEAKCINVPDGLRLLIDGVYSEAEDVPDSLIDATETARGKSYAEASIANQTVLNLRSGYVGDEANWDDDFEPSTRLSDNTIAVRLGRLTPSGSILPWAQDLSQVRHAWSLSEVRVRATWVSGLANLGRELASAIEVARSTWDKYDQGIPLLPLREARPGVWEIDLNDSVSGKPSRLSYSSLRGLEMGPGAGNPTG